MTQPPSSRPFLSFWLRMIFRGYALSRKWKVKKLFSMLTRGYRKGGGIVELDLHGRRMLINAGNPYPFMIREHPLFNLPLVSLVSEVFRKKAAPLNIIDCGAAGGDTAFLLAEKCPAAVRQMFCIDGDDDFLALLGRNAPRVPFPIHITKAMLARQNMEIPSLVRHHQGTASATDFEHKTVAVTLDTLFPATAGTGTIDILKIDIDGFDGEAVAGAGALLARDRPAVIFEWHPDLIIKTGNSMFTAFDALHHAGYTQFLAFRNTGQFSHFGADRREDLELWAKYLLHFQAASDPHFDIVALPDGMKDLQVPLASMGLGKV
jgi:FkbM family methyltransferase